MNYCAGKLTLILCRVVDGAVKIAWRQSWRMHRWTKILLITDGTANCAKIPVGHSAYRRYIASGRRGRREAGRRRQRLQGIAGTCLPPIDICQPARFSTERHGPTGCSQLCSSNYENAAPVLRQQPPGVMVAIMASTASDATAHSSLSFTITAVKVEAAIIPGHNSSSLKTTGRRWRQAAFRYANAKENAADGNRENLLYH